MPRAGRRHACSDEPVPAPARAAGTDCARFALLGGAAHGVMPISAQGSSHPLYSARAPRLLPVSCVLSRLVAASGGSRNPVLPLRRAIPDVRPARRGAGSWP